MKARCLFLMTTFLLALSTPADSSPNEQANKLFVEAVRLIRVAEDEPSAQKTLELLMQAHDNLQTIVDDYPSTDLAVKLISGQSIGYVSLASVNKAVAAAEVAACWESPTYACVMLLALTTA